MSRFLSRSSSEYILCNAAPVSSAPVTVSIWYYPVSGSADQEILCIGDNSGSSASDAFRLECNWTLSTGRLQIVARHGGGENLTSTTLPNLNAWNHIVGTVSSGGTQITYLNGVQISSNTWANGAPTGLSFISFGTFYFGVGGPIANFVDGMLAEAAVWNTVLSPAEVVSLSRGTRAWKIGPPGSLKGWWPLDGLQSPEPDLSGLRNNGTLHGTSARGNPPLQLFTPRWISPPPQIPTLSVSLVAGSFALTGKPVTFNAGTSLPFGAFTFTGEPATFGSANIATLNSGSYALTGEPVTFDKASAFDAGLFAYSSNPGISFGQPLFSIADHNSSGSSVAGATLTLSPKANIVAHSTIVVGCAEGNSTGGLGTLADSAGNTYARQQGKPINNANANGTLTLWTCLDCLALSTSQSWTFTKDTSAAAAVMSAISMTAGTNISLDQNVTPGDGASNAMIATATTTVVNELCVSFAAWAAQVADGFSQANAWNAGLDFKNSGGAPPAPVAIAGGNFIQGAAGSVTWIGAILPGTSRPWSSCMLIFKQGINLAVTASPGIFALTGEPVTFNAGTSLPFGAFTFTGEPATFSSALSVALGFGSYSMVGEAATFGFGLPVGFGPYTITGEPATFVLAPTNINANTGVYTLTGSPATFNTTAGATVSCSGGVFALTGRPATFGLGLLPSAGNYVLTGFAASFTNQYAVSCNFGAYALTGRPITFTINPSLITCDTGFYALAGSPVIFTQPLNHVDLATGFYTSTGGAMSFTSGSIGIWKIRTLPATVWTGECPVTLDDRWQKVELVSPLLNDAPFTFMGGPALFSTGLDHVLASSGSFGLTGGSATFTTYLSSSSLAVGGFASTGSPMTPAVGQSSQLAAGNFALTGEPATFAANALLGAGAFALSGASVSFGGLGMGMFFMTGKTVGFDETSSLLNRGVLAIAGGPAGFTEGGTSDRGVFVLTGEPVVFGRTAALGAGSFALTGEPISFGGNTNTSLGAGLFAFTGGIVLFPGSSVGFIDASGHTSFIDASGHTTFIDASGVIG